MSAILSALTTDANIHRTFRAALPGRSDFLNTLLAERVTAPSERMELFALAMENNRISTLPSVPSGYDIDALRGAINTLLYQVERVLRDVMYDVTAKVNLPENVGSGEAIEADIEAFREWYVDRLAPFFSIAESNAMEAREGIVSLIPVGAETHPAGTF